VLALGTARDGEPWQVGVRDPRSSEEGGQESQILTTCSATEASIVTSGTDQRFYVYDGVSYHHLIDPDTLAPGRLYQSVTVYVPAGESCTISGRTYDSTTLADAISTALFLLSPDEGQELLSMIPGAEAIWVMANGEVIGM
jgi:thiamine biosynthesis lipoprotein